MTGWLKITAGFSLGLLLITGATWAWMTWWYFPSPKDRHEIEGRYTIWHTALAEQRFGDAYVLMAPTYRDANRLDRFVVDFKDCGEEWIALRAGCSLRVHGTHARLYPLAARWNELWNGPDYEWVQVEGVWYLTGKFEWCLD